MDTLSRELRRERLNILVNERREPEQNRFGADAAEAARRFHRSLPTYAETELRSLDRIAEKCGVKAILLKDESSRFGLNAFKGLGGSYAVFRILCERFGMDPSAAVFGDFAAEDIRSACRDIVFVTATDGNHGKGVAWAAKLFGCKAYVYMPAGSVEVRRKAIEDAGAESVVITDYNYDQAVDYADRMAEKNGWVLVQDTAWDGYERIPQWIVEGYLTMGAEISEQIGGVKPTHVFLQAGVGAMAGGMAGYFTSVYRDEPPVIAMVEPDVAACLYKSAKAGDGDIHSVEGNPVTIMAGLNCGTPCRVTWPVIREVSSFFISCPDSVTEDGMREIAYEENAVAGECGAVTCGVLLEITRDDELKDLFGLNSDSVVLLISTEGDTDPEDYRRIVGGRTRL